MSKKELALKRLGHNTYDNTFMLTIPPCVVEDNKWKAGQTLHFKNENGVFTYTDIENQFTKKMRLQRTNVWFVRIPAALIEHLNFQPGQQFKFSSVKGWIQFNPYKNGKLIGIAKKKKTINNLPSNKKKELIEGV